MKPALKIIVSTLPPADAQFVASGPQNAVRIKSHGERQKPK